MWQILQQFLVEAYFPLALSLANTVFFFLLTFEFSKVKTYWPMPTFKVRRLFLNQGVSKLLQN